MEIIALTFKWLMRISFIVWVGSFFLIGQLPPPQLIQPDLLHSPRQAGIKVENSKIEYNGVTSKVETVAIYEMAGLIVSHNDPKKWYRFDLSADRRSLNTRDFCIINGNTLKTDDYQRMSFKNNDYSCEWRFGSDVSNYNPVDISNNHLITDNEEIRRKIDNIRVGDQVYIKGKLANYSEDRWNGFKRNTSLTRTDTGMGACEIIWVEDLQVYHSYNYVWEMLNKYSILVFLGIAAIRFFLLPILPYRH